MAIVNFGKVRQIKSTQLVLGALEMFNYLLTWIRF